MDCLRTKFCHYFSLKLHLMTLSEPGCKESHLDVSDTKLGETFVGEKHILVTKTGGLSILLQRYIIPLAQHHAINGVLKSPIWEN